VLRYLMLIRVELSQIYRKESDPKVKERLLLVLKSKETTWFQLV
jgi:hypothetical protein